MKTINTQQIQNVQEHYQKPARMGYFRINILGFGKISDEFMVAHLGKGGCGIGLGPTRRYLVFGRCLC